MKARKQNAFTLVELLVVIAIIGMLVALLLPAVNSARESARQATCINNQRNVGLAFEQYVAAKEFFPGYRQVLQVAIPSKPNALVSWRITIIPYMQREDLYQSIKSAAVGFASSPAALPYLDFYACPSDNTIVGRSIPWASYVANCGIPDNMVINPNPPPYALVYPWVMGMTPADSAAYGLLVDKVFSSVKTSLTDIKDGPSHTLLISENLDAHQYSDSPIYQLSNPPAGQSIGPNWPNELASPLAGNCSERGSGFIWWDTSSVPPPAGTPPTSSSAPNTVAQINGGKGDYDPARLGWPPPGDHAWPPSASSNFAARPSSNHPGGVVVSFVDAHTKFLRDDIDYRVYCILMTPNGAKAVTVNSGWQKNMLLDEGAY